MAKTKKKNAYRALVVWMLLIFTLTAVSIAGYLMTGNELNDRVQKHKQEVNATNAELQAEYNAAVAEQRRQESEAAAESARWPEASASGWDVLDLSNYSVERGYNAVATRRDMLAGGLLVVNRWHLMPADLMDSYMVSVNRHSRADEDKTNNIPTVNSALSMQQPAVEALMQMFADARAAGLDMDHIIISEGYRSMETQSAYWNDAVAKIGGRYSGDALIEQARKSTAYPGSSDYQAGLSFQVYNHKSGDKEFSNTPLHQTEQGKWLYNNCWKYGYVFRFPIAGFPYEDTVDKSYKTGIDLNNNKVYRYVGEGNAAVMTALGLCLEEYVEYMMEHPHIALYHDGELQYEIYRMEGGYGDTTINIPFDAKSYSASSDNMGGVIVTLKY